MKPNAPKYRQRKSIRLPGYDYAQAGAYFVTICVHNCQPLFGNIGNGDMILNDYGRVAQISWAELNTQFSDIALDAFIVMPNHIHGIIILNNDPADDARVAIAS